MSRDAENPSPSAADAPKSDAREQPTSRSRRRFLKLGIAAGAVGGVGLYRFGCYDTAPYDGLKALSPRAAVILEAVVEAMLPPAADRSLDTRRHCVYATDTYLFGLDDSMVSQFHLLLYAVEHATLASWPHFRRLTRLSVADRARYLRRWQTAPIGKMRLGLDSLKTIVFMAYYSTKKSFAPIGYHGPITPPGFGGLPESQARYDPLLASSDARPDFAARPKGRQP
ncbi:MAG: hypothetical protein KC609_26210 [Myxococcales bacterium]|nr:hypothetical protein [Myxococcales bacterium]